MSLSAQIRQLGLFSLSLALLGADFVQAEAQQFSVAGFADLRLVLPSSEKTWMDGGLGKLRYGDSGNPGVQSSLSEIIADGRLDLVPDLSLRGTLRYAPDQKNALDIIESYAKYQPVGADGWQFSAKAGAFFPPVSLENESIGWSSPWTITSSAINSWIGDEVRIIGLEPRIARRIGDMTLEISGAIYGWNDPLGVLIAGHGWTFNDRPAGLMDTGRLPDYRARSPTRPPVFSPLFREIDDTPGWYG